MILVFHEYLATFETHENQNFNELSEFHLSQ
jgi:hypothetical protein